MAHPHKTHVQLAYKDYADHDTRKVLSLKGEELIRRFLMHVVPKGFMRVRHYGFLANRCRRQALEHIRLYLQNTAEPLAVGEKSQQGQTLRPLPLGPVVFRCPKCRRGNLLADYELLPIPL